MKFIFTSFYLALGAIAFMSAASMNDDPNGKSGATGSPNESTCASSNCHDSYVLNSGPGSIEISSPDLVNWQYVPGQTYTIEVTVSQSNRSLFGLGFEALKSNGDNAGTLVAGTGTQIKSKTVSGFSRKSITHLEDAGATSGSHTFTFTWHSPTTNVGSITFYCAGDACNGNGNESLDYVYSTSQVVDASVGIYEMNAEVAKLDIYPNPVGAQLNLTATTELSGNMEFKLFDSRGAMIESFGKFNQGSGQFNKVYDVSHLSSGSYMIQFLVEGKFIQSKIIQKN